MIFLTIVNLTRSLFNKNKLLKLASPVQFFRNPPKINELYQFTKKTKLTLKSAVKRVLPASTLLVYKRSSRGTYANEYKRLRNSSYAHREPLGGYYAD